MTNETTHENSFLEAPEYRPVNNVTNFGKSRFAKDWSYHVNAGAIKRLADWFDYLKTENVYDNTRIILVSDHGPEVNLITKIGLPFNVDQFNPLLMVKDFNETGEIKTDMTFMTNGDVPLLASESIISNPINSFTGMPLTAEYKKNGVTITDCHIFMPYQHSKYKYNIRNDQWIHVRDNIDNPANWSRIQK
jgi:hypothetical protein